MIDAQTKICANLFALMCSFKIDWSKVQGERYWYMDIIPDITAEVFMFGFISESFFDKNDFLFDKDKEDNIWWLKSSTDHLDRPKVLYHPSMLAKKKEDIRLCCEAKYTKENDIHND